MIASIVITELITFAILTIWPDLLTTKLPDGAIQTFGNGFLEGGIKSVINIIFVFLLAKDMKNEKILSLPVLVVTFFSNLIGVLFFFLILAYNKLKYKQLDQ